jgi:hypothetical protein
MKNGILLVGIAFAVALAAIVGQRLSNDALAVVVGALCGISASIPVTVGLVIAASRNWGREESPREIGYDYGNNRFAPQPPMVIFAPPQSLPSPYGVAYPPGQFITPLSAPALGAPREFKVIGEE